MATKKETSVEIVITRIEYGRAEVLIRGTSPLLFNCMSEKVRQGLLSPAKKKNRSEKESTAKHNPLEEYRNSVYRFHREQKGLPLLALPATSFKGAMKSAALDIPGATKSQIGRLSYVEGDLIPVWGIPEMHMAITRSADMNRTPDVRTRAVVRDWCAMISVKYMKPNLTEQSVVNLLAAAGLISGVGDFRPGKGSGTYGMFELVGGDDKQFQAIRGSGGYDAQVTALQTPGFYDAETESLFTWWQNDTKRFEGNVRKIA